jgi:hypothetical protein
LSIAAYGFLVSERETIPPLKTTIRKTCRSLWLPTPRRRHPARTPRSQLDRHDPTLAGRNDHKNNVAMPALLRTPLST